jgi:hypothetical protein
LDDGTVRGFWFLVSVEPAVVDFGGRLAIQQHLAHLRLVKVLEKVKARLMIFFLFSFARVGQ